VAINNSTLSGNSANGFSGGGGGGIYNDSVVKIDNSTLSGNTGSPSGGGIYNSGTATLPNSLVAKQTKRRLASVPIVRLHPLSCQCVTGRRNNGEAQVPKTRKVEQNLLPV
jgi:hypothetical protein